MCPHRNTTATVRFSSPWTFRRHIEYSGLTKIRTRRRSRRQYK
nr:hypothetical protein [Neisseria meningitidis]